MWLPVVLASRLWDSAHRGPAGTGRKHSPGGRAQGLLCTGGSLPKQSTVAMLQPPAVLVLPLVLPWQAVNCTVRPKWNLQASRCGELPFLLLQNKGQSWEIPCSLLCMCTDCHPTGELHLAPLGVEPSFEDPSTGQRPPAWEFNLFSPLLWREMDASEELLSADCWAWLWLLGEQVLL